MKKKSLSIVVLTMLLAFCLTSCGRAASMATDSSYNFSESAAEDKGSWDMAYPEEAVEYGMSGSTMESAEAEIGSDAAGTGAEVSTGDYSQKLIRTYNFSYETLNFEDSVSFVNAKVAEYGGYIESSETYGSSRRSACFTIRIPEKNANAFLNEAGQIGEMIYKSESTEDITLEYYDISARLETLHTQHDRLIELLASAATLEDIVELERELSDVEYEINSYQSRLRVYDNLVNYVTMYIDISEVTQIQVVEEDSFFTEIKKGFLRNTEDVVEGLLDMIVAIISAIPYLIVLGIVVLIILGIVRVINKKSKKRNQQKQMISEQNNIDKEK